MKYSETIKVKGFKETYQKVEELETQGYNVNDPIWIDEEQLYEIEYI